MNNPLILISAMITAYMCVVQGTELDILISLAQSRPTYGPDGKHVWH